MGVGMGGSTKNLLNFFLKIGDTDRMHHHRVKTIAAMSFLHPKIDINMCHTYMFTIQFFGLFAKYAKWRPSWIFQLSIKRDPLNIF